MTESIYQSADIYIVVPPQKVSNVKEQTTNKVEQRRGFIANFYLQDEKLIGARKELKESEILNPYI